MLEEWNMKEGEVDQVQGHCMLPIVDSASHCIDADGLSNDSQVSF